MKFQPILLFVLSLLSLQSTAQRLKSIDVIFQPELTYRTISSSNEAAKASRNQVDIPGLGYRYGLIFNQFSRDGRRAFRTGLTYSNSGYKKENAEQTQSMKWDAFEIPVIMRLYAGERACATFLDVGIGLHHQLNQDIRRHERTSASLNLGFGFVWAFSENYGISGGIPIRYNLTSQKTGHAIKENLLSTGFEFGVRRYFQ